MNQLSARSRVFLFLLIVAAPITATLALERAAQATGVELRSSGREAAQPISVRPESGDGHQTIPDRTR